MDSPTRVYFCFQLIVAATLTRTTSQQSDSAIREYCERDIFRAECTAPDEVLLITHAQYGRMRHGRCVVSRPLGCFTDVRELLDSNCSGRRRCETTVATLVPDHKQPCHTDYRSYLEAAYECIKVVSSRAAQCHKETTVINIDINTPAVSGSTPVGLQNDNSPAVGSYMSSLIAQQTGCGSYDSPWRLVAPAGLRIRFFLLDFGLKERKMTSQHQHNLPVCQVFAVLREESTVGGGFTVCGGELSTDSNRERLVYTSQTPAVDVRLVAGPTNRQQQQQHVTTTTNFLSQFLLKYELFGCLDPLPPRAGGMLRTDNDVIMWCNETGEQWQLTCDGHQWIGTNKNCTSSVPVNVALSGWEAVIGSKGISILLVLTIAFTVGLLMVVIGSVYLHRLRQRRERAVQLQVEQRQDGYYGTQQYNKQTELQQEVDSQLSENDYYKSWQHHHQQQQQQQQQQRPITASLTSYSDIASANGASRHVVEHIYESPKFDRKSDNAFDFS